MDWTKLISDPLHLLLPPTKTRKTKTRLLPILHLPDLVLRDPLVPFPLPPHRPLRNPAEMVQPIRSSLRPDHLEQLPTAIFRRDLASRRKRRVWAHQNPSLQTKNVRPLELGDSDHLFLIRCLSEALLLLLRALHRVLVEKRDHPWHLPLHPAPRRRRTLDRSHPHYHLHARVHLVPDPREVVVSNHVPLSDPVEITEIGIGIEIHVVVVTIDERSLGPLHPKRRPRREVVKGIERNRRTYFKLVMIN